MNSKTEVKFGSAIYDKINMVRMTESERQAALNAMQDADTIVDAILWVSRKIEQLGALLFMKPSVKH